MPKNIIIQKIDDCYVKDDCVQVMIGYKNGLTLLNADGILYHEYAHETDSFINRYVDDDRRKFFQYHDIPMHREFHLGKIYNYTNQIFEFNKIYFRFFDGKMIATYIIKDNNNTLLINEFPTMYMRESTERVPYSTAQSELNRFFNHNSDTYYITNYGDIIKVNIPNVDTFITSYHQPIWEVTLIDKKMEINGLSLNTTFLEPLEYKLTSFWNIKLEDYNLEQLKYLSKKIKTINNEPRISSILNPNIPKETIDKNKNLVKSFKL